MNVMTKSIVKIIAGACLLTACLHADNVENEDSTERVPVGERSLSHTENVMKQESRALRAEEREPKGGEEELSDEELIAKKTYYTSHEGVFHRPLSISVTGDRVTFEDGSIWQIRVKDRGGTLDWLMGDSVIILPNHSWFSSYHYELLNQNTGKKVKANMLLGPIYNGVYTHWVVAIDYYNKEVCLEDGTVWRISGSDYSTMNKWLVNDTIVLGINDSWFSSKPNILINVNMNNYVAGSCLN